MTPTNPSTPPPPDCCISPLSTINNTHTKKTTQTTTHTWLFHPSSSVSYDTHISGPLPPPFPRVLSFEVPHPQQRPLSLSRPHLSHPHLPLSLERNGSEPFPSSRVIQQQPYTTVYCHCPAPPRPLAWSSVSSCASQQRMLPTRAGLCPFLKAKPRPPPSLILRPRQRKTNAPLSVPSPFYCIKK